MNKTSKMVSKYKKMQIFSNQHPERVQKKINLPL